MGRKGPSRWTDSPERGTLRALYAEVDGLVDGWACSCSVPGASASGPDCCHFAVTGREPYPTAVELEEVRHGMAAAAIGPRNHRKLPLARAGAGAAPSDRRACPLLSSEGRCRIYGSRPFGCRTFFCDHAEPPLGARSLPREAIQALGRRIADLSARFAPRNPGPRPLSHALAATRTHY